jgi:hypothetical protein
MIKRIICRKLDADRLRKKFEEINKADRLLEKANKISSNLLKSKITI